MGFLIAEIKKVFQKLPKRSEKLGSWSPGLSPKPVITWWGTWAIAATYYADHFEAVTSVIDSLSENEAKSIAKCH